MSNHPKARLASGLCSWPSGIHQTRNGVCTRCGAVAESIKTESTKTESTKTEAPAVTVRGREADLEIHLHEGGETGYVWVKVHGKDGEIPVSLTRDAVAALRGMFTERKLP